MNQLRCTQKDSFKKVLAKCRTLKIHYVGQSNKCRNEKGTHYQFLNAPR